MLIWFIISGRNVKLESVRFCFFIQTLKAMLLIFMIIISNSTMHTERKLQTSSLQLRQPRLFGLFSPLKGVDQHCLAEDIW